MPDTIMVIASRLFALREYALNMSHAELCRRTGLAENRWSQYESGKRRITVDAASSLKDEFGVTLDWIYFGDRSGLPSALATKLSKAA